MAGSVGAGKDWAASYDIQVRDTNNLVAALVMAIDTYTDILIEAGYNYAIADYEPGSGGAAPGRPPTPPIAFGRCATPPPSAGGPGSGLVDDGLELAKKVGIDLPVPDGNTDKLMTSANVWKALAEAADITNLPNELERAAALFTEVTAPDTSFIDEDLREMKFAALDLLTTFGDLSTACGDQKVALDDLRDDLRETLNQLATDIATEIAISLALTVAASVVSFGIGGTAVAAIRAGKAADKVKHYVEKIRTIVRAARLKNKVDLQKPTQVTRQKMERIADLVKDHADDAKKTKLTPEEIEERANQLGDEVKLRPKHSEPRNPEYLASKITEMNLSHDEALKATIASTERAFGRNAGTAPAKGGGTVLLPEYAHHKLVMIVKPDGTVVAARGEVTDFIDS